MRPEVRAHRILRHLENYHSAESGEEVLSGLSGSHLGEPIGWYQNPGPSGELIGVFPGGLTWVQEKTEREVKFRDLVAVELSAGKQSEELLLTLRDGGVLRLPVRGQQGGKLFDSLEMLRFLERVMGDLRRLVNQD